MGKNKVGRPTKYRKEFCELAEYILSQDKPMCEVAHTIHVDQGTLRDWKDAYPDFSRACKRGSDAGYTLFMDKLKQAAWDGTIPVNNTLITLFGINCYEMRTNKTESNDKLQVEGKLSVADAVRRRHERDSNS